MTQEDYHEILKIGFGPWLERFLKEKCGDPKGELVRAMFEAMHPIVVWIGVWLTSPNMLNDKIWEQLSGLISRNIIFERSLFR